MTAKVLEFVVARAPRDEATPPDGLAPGRSPSRVAQLLKAGVLPPDRAFDRYLPTELRVVSGRYWTPLVVAARAAEWLADLDVGTVVDIGSGAGKFCVAAALAGTCRFIGLEQRPRLVAAARDLAALFGVEDRVRFVEGKLGEVPTPEGDLYYLYNPFGENLFAGVDHLDQDVELCEERYRRDVAAMNALLAGARAGTYLLTYNGYGGQVPASYQEVHVDREMPNVLRLWRKAGLP